MTAAAKLRKTLTLDPDIVELLGADEAALSTTVNEILRAEISRRKRTSALIALLERLAVERGEVDPDEVAEFEQLLS
jgi:hypothetical protein